MAYASSSLNQGLENNMNYRPMMDSPNSSYSTAGVRSKSADREESGGGLGTATSTFSGDTSSSNVSNVQFSGTATELGSKDFYRMQYKQHDADQPESPAPQADKSRTNQSSILDAQVNTITDVRILRLMEINDRLKNEIARERIPTSSICFEIIAEITQTPDKLVPIQNGGFMEIDEASVTERHSQSSCCIVC